MYLRPLSQERLQDIAAFSNAIVLPFRLFDNSDRQIAGSISSLLRNRIVDIYSVYSDGELKGFAFSYDYRVYDCHMKLSVCAKGINDEEWHSVACDLMERMTARYPVNKYFVETVSDNDIKNWANLGFKVEAVLKEHRYFNGKYLDLYVLGKHEGQK